MDAASKNLVKTTLSQITPAQLMRKEATMRNTQVTLSGKTPVELALGKKPRDLIDFAFMKSRRADIYTNRTGLTQLELAMKTHSEVQQREDTRRDLAEGIKFVASRSSGGRTSVLLARTSEKNSARTNIWKIVFKVEIIAVKGLHGCLSKLVPPFYR